MQMHAESKQRHNKDKRHSSLEKKYTSYFIWKGSKGLLKVLRCERWVGAWQNCHIFTPTFMAITVFLSRSPGLLNRGPEGPACLVHGPHSSILSPIDLNFNYSVGGLRVPSAGCWFSVPHLTSNSNCTSCRGYIIIWRPLFFLRASKFRTQFNPSTVKVISWYSSTGTFPILKDWWGSIGYTTASLQRGKTPPTRVLDMK